MPVNFSEVRKGKILLGDETGNPPMLTRVSINAGSGVPTFNTTDPAVNSTGPDIAITDKDNNPRQFIAEKVWNAVWNDFADFQLLCDELIYGKCYTDTADGAKICTQRCQMGVMGLASNTFGSSVGTRSDQKQVPIAVAGWALAYVDKEYPCGTPLTNNENGDLTEMTLQEKRDFPERLIATYKKKEIDEEFGPEHTKIKVDNRHWVRIR